MNFLILSLSLSLIFINYSKSSFESQTKKMGRKGYSKSRRFSAFFKVCLPRRDQRTSSDRNFTTCSLSPLSIISCWFSLRKLANHKGQQNVFGRHFEEDDAKHGKINEDCMHGGSSSSTAVESGDKNFLF